MSRPSTGGRGRGSRAGASARRPAVRRAGAGADTRVVWPPSKRTETARDAIERVLKQGGIQRGFEPAAQREARRAAELAWQQAEHESRVDLRDLPTFTVDPATARDFDDAISAQALDCGRVRVWVHIADVAAHVPLGSELDLEARRRGTSVYLPGTVEPMLPHALSSGACSLVPGSERLAVTVELLLHEAQVEQASFYRSLIRSDERLDYEQVDSIFASGATAPEPWGAPLAAARTAAAALQARREQSGALVIDSEEPEFRFDEQGNVSEIAPRPQTESHRLIEHLMIAANEAVARQLTQAQAPCLYRVHERPDPERIRRLVEQLHSLGVATPPLPDPLFSAQAAELVGEISRRVDEHVRRSGHGRAALSSLVLRSLKQAYYSPKNLGHAGLRSSCYCHFTSPIRRYPDIVCHRALLATLGARERTIGRRKLVELGEWVSERERQATRLEHKGDDVAACFLLEQVLLDGGYEQVFAGEVTGLIAAGAFVAFASRGGAFEGMLPVRMLNAGPERDWWSLNEQSTILRAERSGALLRLGDPVSVRVVRVDAAAGRVDLAPVG
ncbi:MAG TPA: RNB domain-containing ribonuclease [Solirubrobacteraceae bacterium]|nr:RNB domain-containing ribonuclease [Solirubrobacteraceae bacterium]